MFRQRCAATADRVRQLSSGAGLPEDADSELDIEQVRNAKILAADEMTQHKALLQICDRCDNNDKVEEARSVSGIGQCCP